MYMEDDTLYDKVTLPYTDAAPKGGNTPFLLVILLLIFFPPAAWYIMWKEEEYHQWFSWLIGIYGILTVVGSIIIQRLLIPWSNQIYASVNLQQPEVSPFTYATVFITLGIIEIILAIILSLVEKKHSRLPQPWLILGVMGLALVSLAQPITLAYLTYTGFNNLVEQSKTAHTSPSPTAIPPSPEAAGETE